MNLILGTIGDLKLRAVGKLGGKTKESGFNMWTLEVISTVMTRNTPELLEVSKRFVVLEKNVQIMFGWQQRVSTSQLLKASKDG